jgi:hypothetical protein
MANALRWCENSKPEARSRISVMDPIITLTTDFGEDSPYAAQ